MTRGKMADATTTEEKQDTVIDWDNDPDNAKNWSIAKKLYNTAVSTVLWLFDVSAAVLPNLSR